jgi:hypothetical protein
VRRLLLAPLLLVLLAAAAGAPASDTTAVAKPRLLLGVFGSADRFDGVSGQHTRVGHTIVGWNQGQSWGSPFPQLFRMLGEVPMIGLHTDRGGREVITPQAIALGKGDDYLIALNRAIGEWAGTIYIRPFGEMNGHWNVYSAFNKNGSSRGATHSTAAFKKAFARVYLVVHGGPQVNAKLRRLGLPPVAAELAANPMPRVRVIWNPQGYGSPDLPGNTAQAYYPGDAYVDVVGNDLYNIGGKAEWGANEALYRAHPNKPYAIPEWGNWGIDDPGFVARMAEFARTHRRLELLAYYNGRPGSVWDLGSKPKSAKAYRALIAPLGRG